MDLQPILDRFRALCLALPDTTEIVTFGNPTFRAGKQTFAVFNTHQEELSIALKVEKGLQDVFLEDPRFYRTPYIGQHGWISLRVPREPDWEELAELIQGSHRIASAKPRRTERKSRP